MNRITPALQRGYRSTMRTLFAAAAVLVAATTVACLPSCSATGGFKLPASLPFDLGVRYQLEPGFFIVASPADKGGIDISLEGEGALGKYVVKDGNVWTITSPKTGIVYRVTTGGAKPKIEIVGGGNGKLQLVPKTPPPSDPVLTEPAPPDGYVEPKVEPLP